MRLRSKLLQPRKGVEPILTMIYDVQMKPDGGVEDEDERVNHTLEGANGIKMRIANHGKEIKAAY